ncbi:MAG TPA: helix-turn-helix transcriptional regulator [Allosphingosinicella sp.]|nr:helix-turn-helix transcriptional regulator [Allosphingosinicella sp.]
MADPTLRPRPRWTNPLEAWRRTQRVWDHGRREWIEMSVAEAARRCGVPYQTWHAWEKPREDPSARVPDDGNLKRLFLFTNGQVRPDHFFPIDEWRGELAALAEAAAAKAAAGEEAAAEAA